MRRGWDALRCRRVQASYGVPTVETPSIADSRRDDPADDRILEPRTLRSDADMPGTKIDLCELQSSLQTSFCCLLSSLSPAPASPLWKGPHLCPPSASH